MDCSHEEYFRPENRAIHDDRKQATFGDASWLAAPFLRELPLEVVVFHQLRDPLKTINSLLHTQHLNLGKFGDNRYVAFIQKHTMFPNAAASEEQRAIHFWYLWHQLIETESAGRKYFRYCVEDMSSELLYRCATLVPCALTQDRLSDAISAVRKNENTRGRPPSRVTGELLPDAVRQLAVRYGYHY